MEPASLDHIVLFIKGQTQIISSWMEFYYPDSSTAAQGSVKAINLNHFIDGKSQIKKK